jgi:hypothetical protein
MNAEFFALAFLAALNPKLLALDLLLSHALRLMATVALLLGAYLTVGGLVRLT